MRLPLTAKLASLLLRAGSVEVWSKLNMSRLTLFMGAVICVLAGALAYSSFSSPAPLDKGAMQAMIDNAISAYDAKANAERSAALPAPASIDSEMLNPLIESYLLSDPKILQRMSVALDTTLRAEERSAASTAIASMHDAIFNDPTQVVLGNPQGDVTLVEFFDYNCGYCRAALPDMATLLAEDQNLRVVLKEFPILSNESIDAARVAVLVGEADVDYWAFHEALFTARGQVDKKVALAAAAELGLSPVNLELDMGTDTVSKAIQSAYDIAKELNITGTPTYILGDEIIPGAIGLDELRGRIANMRACGETQCEG